MVILKLITIVSIIVFVVRGNMPYDTDPSTIYYNVDSPTDLTCKSVHNVVQCYCLFMTALPVLLTTFNYSNLYFLYTY